MLINIYILIIILVFIRIVNYIYGYFIYKNNKSEIVNPFYNLKKFYKEIEKSKNLRRKYIAFIFFYNIEEYMLYFILISFLYYAGNIILIMIVSFIGFILMDKIILQTAEKNNLKLKYSTSSGDLIEYYSFLIKDAKDYKYLRKFLVLKVFLFIVSIILFAYIVISSF